MRKINRNPEIMKLLGKYKLNMVASGVLDTTGDQLVQKVSFILSVMEEDFGVRFENGKFYGLTGAVLQDWQAQMVAEDKSPRTRMNYTILLNEFLKWGCGRNLFMDTETDVPLWQVLKCGKLPKEELIPESERKPKFIQAEDVIRLINDMPGIEAHKKRDRAIVAMFVGSGIRSAACCGMNIGDYKNQPHGKIYIKNKGGAWKHTNLAEFAYKFIDEYLETRPDKDDMSAPLFLTKYGTRFIPETMNQTFTAKQKKLGIPQGIHIFRHTFTSAAERAGGAAVARDLAIHKSLTTTNIYTHVTEEDKYEAINAMPWCRKFSK